MNDIVNAHNMGDFSMPGDGMPPDEIFYVPVPQDLISLVLPAAAGSIFNAEWAGDETTDDAEPVGTIAFANGYARMSGSAYLLPDFADSPAISMLIICKKANAADPVGFMGNTGSGTANGAAIYSAAGAASVAMQSARVGAAAGSTATVPATPDQWGMYLGVIPATGQATLHNLSHGGDVTATTAATAARQTSTTPMRIGTIPHGSFGGEAHVLVEATWSRAIEPSEVAAMAAWGRSIAARYGIDV